MPQKQTHRHRQPLLDFLPYPRYRAAEEDIACLPNFAVFKRFPTSLSTINPKHPPTLRTMRKQKRMRHSADIRFA